MVVTFLPTTTFLSFLLLINAFPAMAVTLQFIPLILTVAGTTTRVSFPDTGLYRLTLAVFLLTLSTLYLYFPARYTFPLLSLKDFVVATVAGG